MSEPKWLYLLLIHSLYSPTYIFMCKIINIPTINMQQRFNKSYLFDWLWYQAKWQWKKKKTYLSLFFYSRFGNRCCASFMSRKRRSNESEQWSKNHLAWPQPLKSVSGLSVKRANLTHHSNGWQRFYRRDTAQISPSYSHSYCLQLHWKIRICSAFVTDQRNWF